MLQRDQNDLQSAIDAIQASGQRAQRIESALSAPVLRTISLIFSQTGQSQDGGAAELPAAARTAIQSAETMEEAGKTRPISSEAVSEAIAGLAESLKLLCDSQGAVQEPAGGAAEPPAAPGSVGLGSASDALWQCGAACARTLSQLLEGSKLIKVETKGAGDAPAGASLSGDAGILAGMRQCLGLCIRGLRGASGVPAGEVAGELSPRDSTELELRQDARVALLQGLVEALSAEEDQPGRVGEWGRRDEAESKHEAAVIALQANWTPGCVLRSTSVQPCAADAEVAALALAAGVPAAAAGPLQSAVSDPGLAVGPFWFGAVGSATSVGPD